MTKNIISEEEITQRLKKSGKKEKEIQELLNKYTRATSKTTPDIHKMSEILQKNQENAILRVKGFALTRDQYEVLNDYFTDGKSENENIDAYTLVLKTLNEFIEIIQ